MYKFSFLTFILCVRLHSIRVISLTFIDKFTNFIQGKVSKKLKIGRENEVDSRSSGALDNAFFAK